MKKPDSRLRGNDATVCHCEHPQGAWQSRCKRRDCVTDNLTGLMWVKSPDSTIRTWQEALDYANGLTLCGYTDWRLPNRKELSSLVDYSKYGPAIPTGHPFTNVQSNYYWSSSTDAGGTGYAWDVNMWNGYVGYYDKPGNYYVWPVRVGQ